MSSIELTSLHDKLGVAPGLIPSVAWSESKDPLVVPDGDDVDWGDVPAGQPYPEDGDGEADPEHSQTVEPREDAEAVGADAQDEGEDAYGWNDENAQDAGWQMDDAYAEGEEEEYADASEDEEVE